MRSPLDQLRPFAKPGFIASMCGATRSGLGAVELIVILGIAAFVIACVLIVLPKGRETARMAGCQKNLMQIGVAVLLYEQANKRYPTSNRTDSIPDGRSPVQTMLDALVVPDFLDLRDASQPPRPTAVALPQSRVPGLICPSDNSPDLGGIDAAISYRVNAGDDYAGTTGPLSPGTKIDSAIVEANDGLSFTAGLAERLVGTGVDEVNSPANYYVHLGSVTSPPELSERFRVQWRGDAGSSWSDPGWRSAIYHHATTPNASLSCVAADGRSAAISASSGHSGRVNVWLLDGSLRGVTSSVNPSVWKALGSFRSIPYAEGTSP